MRRYNKSSLLPRKFFQKTGALCGRFFMLVLFVGWPCAHFIPPLAAVLTADQVAMRYHNHESAIKASAGLMTTSAFPYICWVATISGQMSRIPGVPKTAIYTQLLGGLYTALMKTLSAYFMAITAYRFDRPYKLIQLMNAISWILMISNLPGFVIQDLAFSYSVLLDRRPRTLFRRWLQYLSTCLTLFYRPAFGVIYVKWGVVAWNGAFVDLVGRVAGGLNIFMISFYLYQAISQGDVFQEEENLDGTEVSSAKRAKMWAAYLCGKRTIWRRIFHWRWACLLFRCWSSPSLSFYGSKSTHHQNKFTQQLVEWTHVLVKKRRFDWSD